MICHQHTWQEQRRVYTPPVAALSSATGDPESIQKITFGITTVELQCAECGDVNSRVLMGDMTDRPGK